MNEPARQAELRADIEQTRERLGDTVEELAYRANIPARTKEKLQEVGGKVETAAEAAVAKLPEPARQKAAGVVAFVSARPLPAAGGLILLVWLVVRLIRGRSA